DDQPLHALTSFSTYPGVDFSIPQTITYTDFKKVERIREGDYDLSIAYGVDEQRIKSELTTPAGKLTRYYMGDYEEEDNGSNIRKIHYICGGNGLAALYVQNAGKDTLYYVHTDYQGSLIALSLPDGTVAERYAYDPWGNRRNPNDCSQADTRTAFIVNRGYTMHEHLSEFSLINMNGRVYDPRTAMFLSPDPYVQTPGDWLNYNRYQYCLNNPFKYTDPSGDFIFSLFLGPLGTLVDAACWGAVIGGAGYTASVAFSDGGFNNWNWGQFGKSVGIGAASGVLTAGIGASFGSIGSNGIAGEILRATSHGVANGMMAGISGGDFTQGFASGALGSLAGSAFMMYGGDFASSALGTYVFSGLAGGAGAELTGGNFWQGSAIGIMNAGLNHLSASLDDYLKAQKLVKKYMKNENRMMANTFVIDALLETTEAGEILTQVREAIIKFYGTEADQTASDVFSSAISTIRDLKKASGYAGEIDSTIYGVVVKLGAENLNLSIKNSYLMYRIKNLDINAYEALNHTQHYGTGGGGSRGKW
ncbi:MAG: hypothetical protein LBO74_14630, partial [Candidatus Symbiothrix sp.]|nr:hypothetical protein [Candidatus Symbiothrix sp.]